MPGKRVSSVEVAKAVGVSQATVSYVLSGRWRENGISSETRAKVEATARKLGYRTNRMAQSLKLGKSMVIGVIAPSVTFSYFSEIVRGAEAELSAAGYILVLLHSHENPSIEQKRINVIKGYNVDGLIAIPTATGGKAEVFEQLLKERWPLVLVDKKPHDIEANFVGTDDIAGARAAVDHLISMGHQRIAFVSGPPGASTAEARKEGYVQSLRQNGIPHDEQLIVGCDWTQEDGAWATEQLLQRNPRPTAIFACTDVVAWGVYTALHTAGLRIPDDVSVVGYADLQPSSMITPALTTIRQPAAEVGRRAARILLDNIEKGRAKPRQVLLPVELILRNSTGPVSDRT